MLLEQAIENLPKEIAEQEQKRSKIKIAYLLPDCGVMITGKRGRISSLFVRMIASIVLGKLQWRNVMNKISEWFGTNG